MNAPTCIDFTVGSRRLVSVERDLASWSFTLEQALNGCDHIATPKAGADGLRVLSAPLDALPVISAQFPNHLIGGRQDYRRHFIEMSGSYEEYLARFSGKTRSTLRRKQRKLAKDLGEAFAISEHRTPAEIEAFLDAAIPLSAKTYQARLLDAGLPESKAARSEMLQAAEGDRMRCYLLHSSDGPIAYLSLPVIGKTLVYAHLGYDPAWSKLSPGTVLQMEALERLFAEQRYRYFDFTEGEGAHKAMFGTDSVECCSFVLLKPTMANRTLLSARAGFDDFVALSKSMAEKSGALGKVRAALRN